MNVLYTCDNNYVWLMGISTISLFENNKELHDIVVYLLGENISLENKGLLRSIAKKYNRKINVINVPVLHIPQSLISARWPQSAFTRLYSGLLLPENVEKVLYMDCDTIISGQLTELETYEFDGKHIFYGIKDCIGSSYKKNIGLDGNDAYINAGVLLMDLKCLRKVDMNRIIEDYMVLYGKMINYADQDLLNGMFNKKITYLNPKYNVMTIAVVHTYREIQMLRKPTNYYSKQEIEQAIKNPVIIHYTTNMIVVRPWFSNSGHPLRREYEKYFEMSPWKNQKLVNMQFNSIEAKIISVIQVLPKKVSYRILGLIHAEIKPWVIARKAK